MSEIIWREGEKNTEYARQMADVYGYDTCTDCGAVVGQGGKPRRCETCEKKRTETELVSVPYGAGVRIESRKRTCKFCKDTGTVRNGDSYLPCISCL
jgi:hypothetical protein